MYVIEYKYPAGTNVWVKDGNTISEMYVSRIVLEVDPDEVEGLIERKTYHLDPLDDGDMDIILKLEADVYLTAEDAISETESSVVPQTIDYTFTVDDVVWTYENYCDLECAVNQISFYVNPLSTDTIYHLLPIDGSNHLLLKSDELVYATQQEALDAIAAIITPTPTISITASVTPQATPDITQTVTPTLTPTMTVTPESTPTPSA
jgi:hypothetical protein